MQKRHVIGFAIVWQLQFIIICPQRAALPCF
jgi:hypothetical protein